MDYWTQVVGGWVGEWVGGWVRRTNGEVIKASIPEVFASGIAAWSRKDGVQGIG